MIPFVDLHPLAAEVAPGFLADAAEIVAACDFVGGPRVTALEGQLCEVLGVQHTVAVANGTDALVLGLRAMGVGPGDVVALPNLTFWATYEAIVAVGATPLLVDVDPDDLQLSLSELRAAHEQHRFTACILVHLFGWASGQLAEIRAFCRERNIRLLEDGAQSFGVRVHGEALLEGADIATLSFYPAKVIGGAGDGGAVTCAREEDADLVCSLANHGRASAYGHERVGQNSRMGGLQAAYLSRVVAMADRIIGDRLSTLDGYAMAIDANNNRGLRLNTGPSGVRGNGYLAVVTSDHKSGADLATGLTARGVGNARTYPTTVADQPGVAGDILVPRPLPVSRAFCERVVNLPLYFGLSVVDADAAAAALLECA